MKKILAGVLICSIILGINFAAFAIENTIVNAIIEKAKTFAVNDQKVRYLIAEANKFYNAKNFQPVIDIAQYILKNVDKNSKEAKNLLEKAKQGLQASA